jgi:hypothetical protein
MKRKPMLYTKINKDRYAQKEVIGLVGVHPGAGVTYTGILLAFCLGEELGRRTAFLEVNKNHDLSLFQPVYEWIDESAGTFTYGNITFYKDVEAHQVAGIIGEGYDCCILDFGTDFQENKEEFLRCSRKLLINGHSEWCLGKLIRFMRGLNTIRGSASWFVLIPLAPRKMHNRLRKELNRTFDTVPYEADVTKPSKAFIRLSDRLLG